MFGKIFTNNRILKGGEKKEEGLPNLNLRVLQPPTARHYLKYVIVQVGKTLNIIKYCF